ncbi:hypothetical protein LSH36_57g02028 [Paralvinella palmiformis]|uniref:Uncharacterized protein n=1 Tax=Paralvinella palmiformis TaxID=53620 RepID=A0AAD9K5S9_9ANNE|nr:hypothetical protein LSH36_57g02028 [Paralvinella palmiformis]
MPHTPAVPDISSMADITHCSFVVPEIIEHQDIGNELPAFAIAEELPELSYKVVEVPTVFVLMSGKSAEDYKSVLSHLMLQNDCPVTVRRDGRCLEI